MAYSTTSDTYAFYQAKTIRSTMVRTATEAADLLSRDGVTEPELAARIAQNAYEESRKYTWDVVRGQWVEVYRGVLGRP